VRVSGLPFGLAHRWHPGSDAVPPSRPKAGQMRSLNDLDTGTLKVCLTACGTLMEHKAYLPVGGLLVMFPGRYRDDIREALGLEAEDIPRCGKEHRPLDEMTSAEPDAAWGAVMVLLQERFTKVMDDPDLPKLLRAFQGDLAGQGTEREQIRASITS
jgi:hypothetical protein